nr:unnamed protein product [Haemonchus contortus]
MPCLVMIKTAPTVSLIALKDPLQARRELGEMVVLRELHNEFVCAFKIGKDFLACKNATYRKTGVKMVMCHA